MTTQQLIDDLFREGVPYAESLNSRIQQVLVSMGGDSAAIAALFRDYFPYASTFNSRLRTGLELVGVSAADTADLFADGKNHTASLNERLLYAFAHAGPSISFTGTIAEGTTTGRAVGTATLANPPVDIGTLTWSELGTGTGAALFAINSSTGAVTNSAALDYETATSYTYGIQVTDGVYTYTLLAPISVTNVLEVTLGTVALDSLTFITSTSDSGTITGKTSGSTLSLSGSLPSGLTLNLGALTWAWSGTGSVSTGSFTIVETHPDATTKNHTQSWEITDTVVLTNFTVASNSWVFNGAYWYDDFVTANPTITVSRVSGNGWALADITSNIASIAAQDPHVVLIDEAINSLNTAMTAATYLSDVQTLVAAIRAACPNLQKIGVAECPPSTSGTINTKRATVNPGLRALVGSTIDFIVPANMSDADASDPTYIDNASPPGHPAINAEAILLATRNAVIAPIFAGATATSPSAFTFLDIGGAPVSHAYRQFTSAPVTGMVVGNGATGVLTGSGTWQLGRGGTANTSDKTVYNGDWPAINQTSSATFPPETAVNSTLTIGTRADTFTTTTGALATDTFTRTGALGTTETGSLTWVGPATADGSAMILGQQSKSFGLVDTSLTDVDFTFDVTIPGSGSPQVRLLFAGNVRASPATTNPSSYLERYYVIDFNSGQILAHHESFGDFGGVSTGFTAFTAGTYTCRVVYKRSDSSIKLYKNGSLIDTGTMRGDIFPTTGGTFVGGADEQASANSGITFDNFSVQAAA